ncbi:MAG: tetratricopeptide repeat protein [Rhodothermales bacterium]|nr:tetratricopeptide repeat protein [Rhodothermales bacterium]MBO6780939.1 tetratricopeptide repeat protein [Rhodothermales bacterium]
MDPVAPLSKGKRRLFIALTALIPLLFFVLLESGLRLAGYGASYPLFQPVPGVEQFRIQNREVARRYFAQQERVPGSIGDAFLAEKTPETWRLFVQGGSSAAGYPYYYGGSFSRMLEQRLQQTYPDRSVEVVNTAMAAVNSYTLLDLADEIRAEGPDAVLIYAGHNEFYGALGIGSAESLGQSRTVIRWYLRLQNWRTVQLLRSVLGSAAGLVVEAPDGPPGATLMERMVGEQEIPIDSDVYEAGIAQFRDNLRRLLAVYEGIPVYLATVASNERDHAPFMSAPERDPEAWRARLAAAVSLPDSLAAPSLRAMGSEDAVAADVHFLLGRSLDRLEQFEEARTAYRTAKDRDRLRFRASEDINAVIREEAASAGAVVVDVQEVLAAASPGGVIDGSLMLEHLHPNAEGYFLMADAFYNTIVRTQGGGRFVPPETARDELLITPIDSLFGQYRVMQLMGSWPFEAPGTTWTDTLRATTATEDIAIRLFRGEISWFEATNALMNLQRQEQDWHGALRTALAQIQQYPFLPAPYAAAGEILLRQRRSTEALAYFDAALELEESAQVRAVIGDVHAALGRHELALEAYLVATRLDATNADYVLKLGRSHALLGDTLAAATALEAYLNRQPDDERVQRVLAAIRARQ